MKHLKCNKMLNLLLGCTSELYIWVVHLYFTLWCLWDFYHQAIDYVLRRHRLTERYVLRGHRLTERYVLRGHRLTERYVLRRHRLTERYVLRGHRLTERYVLWLSISFVIHLSHFSDFISTKQYLLNYPEHIYHHKVKIIKQILTLVFR